MKDLVKNLWFDNSGAHAIEVAAVFSVFSLIVISGLEFGLIMYASSLLDSLTTQAARFGKTGYNYGQDQGISRRAFIRQYIRNEGGAFFRSGRFALRSTIFADITQVNLEGVPTPNFRPGAGGRAVLYRVTYNWDILTPFLLPFGNSAGNFPIQSAVVVQNEDF